jgi:dihydroflavonol-4-reductase
MLGGTLSVAHVDDVAQGHLLAMDRGMVSERYILAAERIDATEFVGRACDVAGVPRPRVMPLAVARVLAAVLEPVARVTGRPPDVARDTVAMLAQGLCVDGSKAARDLGLRYRTYDEALPSTLRWYWEQGLLARKPACVE